MKRSILSNVLPSVPNGTPQPGYKHQFETDVYTWVPCVIGNFDDQNKEEVLALSPRSYDDLPTYQQRFGLIKVTNFEVGDIVGTPQGAEIFVDLV